MAILRKSADRSHEPLAIFSTVSLLLLLIVSCGSSNGDNPDLSDSGAAPGINDPVIQISVGVTGLQSRQKINIATNGGFENIVDSEGNHFIYSNGQLLEAVEGIEGTNGIESSEHPILGWVNGRSFLAALDSTLESRSAGSHLVGLSMSPVDRPIPMAGEVRLDERGRIVEASLQGQQAQVGLSVELRVQYPSHAKTKIISIPVLSQPDSAQH